MPFKLTDDHYHQFHSEGYAIFRNLLPVSLIADLRKAAAKGRDIAREKDGPDAQRLQPLGKHADIGLKPFEDYASLPELNDAIKTLIAPDATVGGVARMGILYEPANRPWATQWHRDFSERQQRVDAEDFREMRTSPDYFHQINCALYEDTCTWYVPGSFLRSDLQAELDAAHATDQWQVGCDHWDDWTNEQLEAYCMQYTTSMPRCVCVALNAGDLAIYRAHGWHIGCYAPYKQRATLHDSVWTPRWKAAFDRWAAGGPMQRAESAEAR